MRSATESASVSREESIHHVCDRARQRQVENPREPSPATQLTDDLLDGRCTFPCRVIRPANKLQRLGERGIGNPRKSLAHSRRLRRNDLEHTAVIHSSEPLRERRTHAAVTVVDHRVARVGACGHVPGAFNAIAGCCCVRQCSVPSPQTRSTAWIPTTWRPGNTSPMIPSAIRSFGSLNVGTITTSFAT